MQIDRDLVMYLEKLGRIELSEEQRTASEKDLQDILTYIDTLNELNTDGVEPASHSFPVANVMRRDEVKNAPQVEEPIFTPCARKTSAAWNGWETNRLKISFRESGSQRKYPTKVFKLKDQLEFLSSYIKSSMPGAVQMLGIYHECGGLTLMS